MKEYYQTTTLDANIIRKLGNYYTVENNTHKISSKKKRLHTDAHNTYMKSFTIILNPLIWMNGGEKSRKKKQKNGQINNKCVVNDTQKLNYTDSRTNKKSESKRMQWFSIRFIHINWLHNKIYTRTQNKKKNNRKKTKATTTRRRK